MLILFILGCGGGTHIVGGGTIDLMDGTYIGYPSEGSTAEGVKVRDEDSTLAMRFYAKDEELWTLMSFRGDMVVDGIVLKEEDCTIEGMTVDGAILTSSVELSGMTFNMTGLFDDGRSSLALVVTNLGSLTLLRQGGAGDTGSGDTGDTGTAGRR